MEPYVDIFLLHRKNKLIMQQTEKLVQLIL